MEINELINNNEFESINIEYKEVVSHKNYEKWAKTIAAFANCEGGSIFFGINDDDEVVGINKDQIKIDILFINDIIDKKINPRIKYKFNKIKVNDDLYILELIIDKNDNTPVWLTRSDNQDVIYIRRDGQSVIAHYDQIEELVLNSKRLPYDKLISDYRYKDLTFNKLNTLYKDNTNSDNNITVKQLESINAVKDGYVSYGLLLFEDNFINCNVTCRLWPGTNKGSDELIDKKSFSGNIIDLLDFSRNYINLYIKNGLVKNNGKGRKSITSYPLRAIEEALINAIAHRDYYINGSQIDIDIFKDRIEIISPGSFILPGNAQDYQINRIPSRRRNEIICDILELCDLMEESGSGFEKIFESYKDYNEKFTPKVYSDPSQFIITLYDLTYKDTSYHFNLPETGNRIYDEQIIYFCDGEAKSRLQIQNYLELSDPKYFRKYILNPLIENKVLLPTKASINAPNQKYYVNKNKI